MTLQVKTSFSYTGTAQNAEVMALAITAITDKYSLDQTHVVHFLKTTEPYYGKVKSGQKKAEFRLDDKGRNFSTGDFLVLEMFPYSGEFLVAKITDATYVGEFIMDRLPDNLIAKVLGGFNKLPDYLNFCLLSMRVFGMCNSKGEVILK